ncbi:pectate lyase, PelA/Pel-15E family [Alteromonadaceae bacterium Bs31]|nr:pectate lyase, PelA/Pel-15E family [Alteromonadaceae bacterium Bs31]
MLSTKPFFVLTINPALIVFKQSLLFCFLACTVQFASSANHYVAIPLDDFSDVIKHWHDQNTGGGDDYYKPEQILEIANNLLLYQRANGGWPTNKDPLRKLNSSEAEKIRSAINALDSSLDNRNTYPQIRYLAAVFQQTQKTIYRDAAIKGLEYILQHQYPSGGWAHSPPRTDSYYGHITFADEVMPGVLTLLRQIVEGDTRFDFVAPALKARCENALQLGDKLLLQLQLTVNGKPAVWAGQYDRNTLKPAGGRSYELPSLLSWESVAVVRYLMSIPNPGESIVEAVENAIDWFEAVKIEGIAIEKFDTEPVRFKYHTSSYDLRVVKQKNAAPLWARFYDLQTNKPLFANRDGSQVSSLAEVKRDRRTGYDWYGNWPQKLLDEDYPEWKKRNKPAIKSEAVQ